MVRLELPHINVLSKIDLIEQYGKLGTLRPLSWYPVPHRPRACTKLSI